MAANKKKKHMAKSKKKSKTNLIKFGRRSRGNKLALIAVVLIVAAAGVKLLINSLAATSSFTYLATHPQASQQSTALGKTLLTLKAWNGKIYAGYGDYGANTGPIALTPFNPQTNTFASSPEASDLTEAIYIFRNIGGNLYAPSTDPRYGLSTDYAVETPPGGTWTQSGKLGGEHVFDAATLTGSDLWFVGAIYGTNQAGAWRSTDGGATWQKSLAVSPTIGGSNPYSRFYFAGVLNGKLYVQAFDGNDSGSAPQSSSQVFDGSGWSKGPNLLPNGGMGYHTENFAGKLVYLLWQGYPSATRLTAFDGSKATTAATPAPFWEYVVDNGTLYGLGYDNVVYSTKDLVTWYKAATAPSTARSIAVLNGQIYVGTTDSKIYSAPIVTDPTPLSGSTGGNTKVHGGGGGGGGKSDGAPGHKK